MVSNVTPKFMKGKYSGQSSGQKPMGVQNGSVYFEVDTGKYYMYDAEGKQWYEQKDNGSGSKPKPEQEKTVDITSNGTVVVEPDAGFVLSKVTANVNVQSGGGECEAMLDGIIDGSVTEIRNDRVKKVGDYAFNYYSALTTVSLLSATSIGNSAFRFCSKLTTIDLPVATSIGDSAFQSCSELTTINLPVATSIKSYAFQSCLKLATIGLPSVTSIGNYTLAYCSELTTIELPAVISIGYYTFAYCSELTTIDLPVVTSIGDAVFRNCSALTTLRLSSPTLCNTTGDPYINSTCKIYVPASLIEQYKVATNWSKYASQFVAIEGV